MHKQLNHLVLILALVVYGGVYAHAGDKIPRAENTEETIYLDANDAAELLQPPTADIPDNGDQFADFVLDEKQKSILKRALINRANFIRDWNAQLALIGEDGVKQKVKDNDFNFDYETGRAELVFIDGKPVIRCMDEASQFAIVFPNSDEIKTDSKHLRQYLARQHIDSDSRVDPTKKVKPKKRGRDVILAWMQKENLELARFIPRHRLFSKGFWKDWWWASFKVPTKGDLVLGTLCGVAQFGLAACVSAAKSYLDPNSHFSWISSDLAFIWGASIGVWASTYRNIVYRGNMWSQTAKSSVVGLSFAYTLTILTEGSGRVLNIIDTAGILLNLHIISNTVANRWASMEWGQPSRIRTFERKNTDPLIWNLPILGRTEMNRASVENQAVYLIPFVLKLGDLTGVTIDTGMGVLPLGKALLWGSIPVAQYITLKYAQSQGYSVIPELQERWAKTKRAPLKLLKGLVYAPWNLTKLAFGAEPLFMSDSSNCADNLVDPTEPSGTVQLDVEEITR